MFVFSFGRDAHAPLPLINYLSIVCRRRVVLSEEDKSFIAHQDVPAPKHVDGHISETSESLLNAGGGPTWSSGRERLKILHEGEAVRQVVVF